MRKVLLVLIASISFAPDLAVACGSETDCSIGERVYRIAMPDSGKAEGALVFMHGYGGSHKGAMKNKALKALAHKRGLALVSTKSASKDWLIPGVPENPAEDGEKELVYFDALIDELEARHGIDRNNLIASGFSAGGMMVWNLACHRGEEFRAFIPVAGTFWDPVPQSCVSFPVNLIHVHGTADRIVPLGGRKIRTTKQGDVPTAIAGLIEQGGFQGAQIAKAAADLDCELRNNEAGNVMAFCTHPGGHSFKSAYLRAAFDLLER